MKKQRSTYPGSVEGEAPATGQGSGCYAYGCPMHGAMSTSTTGAKQDWLCWLHFGKDAGQWNEITAEINRVGFLAEAIRILRHNYGGPGWAPAYREAKNLLIGGQRNDLLIAQSERVLDWMARLEGDLGKIARPAKAQGEMGLAA